VLQNSFSDLVAHFCDRKFRTIALKNNYVGSGEEEEKEEEEVK